MRYFNVGHYKSLVELKRRIDKVNIKGIEIAERRMEIIRFYDEYGREATRKAFGVSKATIYNWKKILKTNGNEIRSLIPLSRRPIRRRVSKISPMIEEFIRDYRIKHPRAGQYVIKVVLDKFCEEKGLKKISESSIAKIIKKLKERGEIGYGYKMSYNARSGKISVRIVKRKKKERRKGYRPEKAGDLVQIDAITMFKDGIRRYIITAIDVKSKFGFGYAYSNLSSRSAKDFMEKLEYVFPFKINRIQTDNGSEFEKEFDRYLKEKGLTHYYNYPRHPQSNGCVERFNRTIREDFIDFTEETIFDDIMGYNRKLMEWLIWYNGEKRHRSIDMTPIEYILKEKNLDPKKSNMYVNHGHVNRCV